MTTQYVIPKQKHSTYYYIVQEIARDTKRVVVVPLEPDWDIDAIHRGLYKYAPDGWSFALDRVRNEIHVIKWKEMP